MTVKIIYMNIGKLYVVATPIGNLGDMTLRGVETLRTVDAILCEDTRVTAKLLAHFEISKPLIAAHEHNSGNIVQKISQMLEEGKNLAMVTDAGTPGISDPGNRLIENLLAIHSDLEVVSIPGASAVVALLSVSGFATDKFYFGGFPPHKGRESYFRELAVRDETLVFYESPHRILKCFGEISKYFSPERQIVVGRELTKKFETIYRGTVGGIASMSIPDRGEFVIAIKNK